MSYVDEIELETHIYKPKIHYTWLNLDQKNRLVEEFDLNPIWSLEKTKELAKELGIDNYKKVYKWHFEHQRSKWNINKIKSNIKEEKLPQLFQDIFKTIGEYFIKSEF